MLASTADLSTFLIYNKPCQREPRHSGTSNCWLRLLLVKEYNRRGTGYSSAEEFEVGTSPSCRHIESVVQSQVSRYVFIPLWNVICLFIQLKATSQWKQGIGMNMRRRVKVVRAIPWFNKVKPANTTTSLHDKWDNCITIEYLSGNRPLMGTS